MGIEHFYSYCLKNISNSYKNINILEEIEIYKRNHHNGPLIIINISTLAFNIRLNPKDLICGYRFNKIKQDFENFLLQLKDAGAELEFVFKKTLSDDLDSMECRFKDGCNIISTIKNQERFDVLIKVYKNSNTFPYNSLIQVALIQSAEKFGLVHGFNDLKGKPTVQQTKFAKEKRAAFIMGLDTYYFLIPGPWKIWCDSDLDMEAMTIRQFHPRKVLEHFNLKAEQVPLFACLVGDLFSPSLNMKIQDHFVPNYDAKQLSDRFPKAANFLRRLKGSSIDEMLQCAIKQIFRVQYDSSIVLDFEKSMKTYEIDETAITEVDEDIQKLFVNDFLNFANEIFFNTPIFIDPILLDLQMSYTLEELAMPLIRKTAGVLLKYQGDQESQKVISGPNFKENQFDVISPDFEVPSLQVLLVGEISTMEKMEILSFVTDIALSDLELQAIPEEFIVDTVILLYLTKNKSLSFKESICIMATIVAARRQDIPSEAQTIYPTKISERALLCGFIYSKMYLIFHSCLSLLGMKNFRTQLNFDGVYFQRIFKKMKKYETLETVNPSEIVKHFLYIIEM